jgi:hypothetical protein
VCRLSMRGHALPCKKTITAYQMARLFVVHCYPWVGLQIQWFQTVEASLYRNFGIFARS